ncbi:MAG: glycosyl transferase, family 2 [Candidatus Eremiobacteraeota bacterium]|nr:glycosyl transferase, family 2 [Candidatus Eremiobacteraeota bacterium]
MADLRRFADRATLALSLASLAYGAFALERTLAFGRRTRRPAARAPYVTILKALHGDEPLLAQKLRSFCDQDYPSYDVVLGARNGDDPALATASVVATEFSDRVRVVSANDGTPHHANPKIDTLAALVPHARGDILVFADSDMRVTPDYLLAIVEPFADERVGAVTCLYRGVPADGGVASRLGAMANHEHFAPSVLIAERLLGMRFGFGSTIAVRRTLFEEIGGLDAIGAHLADDALLCAEVTKRGAAVVLSDYVVENVVDEPTFPGLWSHELRWARTQRALEPGGFAGVVLTYPIPLALLHVAVARERSKPLVVLGAAIALRYALAFAAACAFGARPAPLLVPLRDTLGLAVWCASFISRGVHWSGDDYRVNRDGRMTP